MSCPYTTAPDSPAGALRHYRRGEKPCPACLIARRNYATRRRRAAGIPPEIFFDAAPLVSILRGRGMPLNSMGERVRRAIYRGRVTLDTAEHAADQLGLLPCEIWDDYYAAVAA